MDVIHSAKTLIGHALRPFHAGSEKLVSHDQKLSPHEGSLAIQSEAFEADGLIPREYSGEGDNISPPIRWSGVPADARELVLICEDPDAPKPEPYIHWIIYGLSAQRMSLPQAVAPVEGPASLDAETRQGKNSAGRPGYTGPMPPPAHGVHHYHFQLFALDEPAHTRQPESPRPHPSHVRSRPGGGRPGRDV